MQRKIEAAGMIAWDVLLRICFLKFSEKGIPF